ncbi:MAG: uroporphyrinogen-III synthase [Gammaproteobacteria bacterium]|nr:uroporphyrinogen-III synthase [Gammaproteobacteria bacterium]
MSQPLEGYMVMVTRPEEQAHGLIDAIKARGGRVVFAPMIAIEPVASSDVQQALASLDTYDAIIFISRNAAEIGLRQIAAAGARLTRQSVFAVGVGTASRLHELGIAEVHAPRSEFSSEGLLKLLGLSAHEINGKRVLIVRGVGGRELLAHALQQRGALVDYCEVYERRVPSALLGSVLKAHGVSVPDIVVVTSPEALTNLADKIDQEGLQNMFDVPIMVAGHRAAQEVDRLGFSLEPVVVENPGDASVVEALVVWANNGQ